MNLVEMLVDNLGVDDNQAKGGTGLLLGLAKDQLSGGDFGKIADMIPGADDMISAAPKAGGLGGVLGGLGSMLGGKAGNLGQLAALAGGFSKLGLDTDMVQKFVPIVMDYLQKEGGDEVMNILQKVIK